jgi:hypothetical protein
LAQGGLGTAESEKVRVIRRNPPVDRPRDRDEVLLFI